MKTSSVELTVHLTNIGRKLFYGQGLHVVIKEYKTESGKIYYETNRGYIVNSKDADFVQVEIS